MDKRPRVVLITTPTGLAESVARAVTKEKLAACVNIVPLVRSFYWWEDELQQDDESLLLIKTTDDLIQPMIDCVRNVHPHENFELIALDISDGNKPYLDWIVSSTAHSNA